MPREPGQSTIRSFCKCFSSTLCPLLVAIANENQMQKCFHQMGKNGRLGNPVAVPWSVRKKEECRVRESRIVRKIVSILREDNAFTFSPMP